MHIWRDRSAIERNPLTIARICGRLKEMGLNKIYENLSQPKETNRQIGPLFKRWVNGEVLGLKPISINDFISTKENAILDASDAVMKNYAKEHLGYGREKGLDFIARFNNKIIISEAKFLTDFGGHQNAQLEDALQLLKLPLKENVIKIAILDGVCYVKNMGMKIFYQLYFYEIFCILYRHCECLNYFKNYQILNKFYKVLIHII